MHPESIAEIFLNTVDKFPQHPALILPDQSWSYEELGGIVNSAAIKFKKLINFKNSRIVIIGDNHPAYVVAYFAAQCIGASTVEVSRNESLDTLLSIVKATGAIFVVTDRDDLRKTLETQLHVESFQEFLTFCEASSIDNTDLLKNSAVVDCSKEASIVYTSGTTGSAKGVILSHENFCFITHAIADYLKLTHEDRYALVLALCHTYGKSILLSSFAVGASVIMINDFKNIPNFLDQLVHKNCTVLSAVPYHINVLLKGGHLEKYDLSSLRAITSSANKLSHTTIDNLTNALPEVQLFSMYGLTESTTRTCYMPPDILQTKKNSCGMPLPGVEIRIVDKDGTDLSEGQAGEILLRGPNIMKGYFEDSKLTEDTLINGWLRTGDIGFVDDEGFLYITGRKKDIIKCAGERISALEIEEVLLEHEGVEEVAVIGQADSLMGEIIHAYVVPSSPSLKKNELLSYCFKRLSHHKVPYHYTFVGKLPKTETGKVKKYLLASC